MFWWSFDYLSGSGMGWYPSIHSQDGNIKGVSDVSSEFNGLRIALITEVLPLDACDPVAPMGPN